MLNLFYQEPDPDRWFPFDRYPRRVIRRIARGQRRPGGQERVFLNLQAGLDRLGVRYRVNDYHRARRHPEEIACIIGKPHVLDKIDWQNPVVFGAATFSHPLERPDFLQRYPTVKKILVPGEWMRRMWEPYLADIVTVWPVGIDTEQWKPVSSDKEYDFLLYDKVRWKHEEFEKELIQPIRDALCARRLTFLELRYGSYAEQDYHRLLKRCRAMIFLCEHETQGIAYQQALSAGVPILAWDRGGYWQDPSFFPDKVKFEPVTAVPYWDERCGATFRDFNEFPIKLEEFSDKLRTGEFVPRDYILENLTLEKCARRYVEIHDEVAGKP